MVSLHFVFIFLLVHYSLTLLLLTKYFSFVNLSQVCKKRLTHSNTDFLWIWSSIYLLFSNETKIIRKVTVAANSKILKKWPNFSSEGLLIRFSIGYGKSCFLRISFSENVETNAAAHWDSYHKFFPACRHYQDLLSLEMANWLFSFCHKTKSWSIFFRKLTIKGNIRFRSLAAVWKFKSWQIDEKMKHFGQYRISNEIL